MKSFGLKRWKQSRVWERIKSLPDRKKSPKDWAILVAPAILLAFGGIYFAVRMLAPVSPGSWQPLGAIFRGEAARTWEERLVRENYAPGAAGVAERAAIRVRRIDGGIEPLYWLNFNDSQQLCGLGGCLQAVYRASGERLLALYLRSPTIEGRDLFEVKSSREDFPRLLVWQSVSDRYLERVEYVFQAEAGQYFALNRSRFEVKEDGSIVELKVEPLRQSSQSQPGVKGDGSKPSHNPSPSPSESVGGGSEQQQQY